jgi:hypothetical protein
VNRRRGNQSHPDGAPPHVAAAVQIGKNTGVLQSCSAKKIICYKYLQHLK